MTRVDVQDAPLESLADAAPWRTILLVGASVALLATVGQWVVAAGVGLSIRPLGLAVVAAGVVVGRPARWGSAVALFLVGLLAGGLASGVAWAVAAFVAAAVSVRLWAHGHGGADESWVSWALRYAVVAVAGVLILAATSSWLLDVLGRAAFSVTVAQTVTANLPLAVVGAPLVRLVAERTGEHWSDSSTRPPTVTTRVAVVLALVCWVVGGYVGSFLFRAVAQVPPESLARRLSPTVQEFVALWGWQGTHAQLLLGMVALTVVGLLLRR